MYLLICSLGFYSGSARQPCITRVVSATGVLPPLLNRHQVTAWRILEDRTIVSEQEPVATPPSSPVKAKPTARTAATLKTKSELLATYNSPYAAPQRGVSRAGRTYSYTFGALASSPLSRVRQVCTMRKGAHSPSHSLKLVDSMLL